jgi:predicted DNA-binding transcriptional regulator AlpA
VSGSDEWFVAVRQGDRMRFLSAKDLQDRGITFSRQHRHRLIKQGKFPRPVKIGANTNAWPEPEIDAYQEDCIRKRDAKLSSARDDDVGGPA